MGLYRFFITIFLYAFSTIASYGQGIDPQCDLKCVEKLLKTDGVISRYHRIIEEPYRFSLNAEGFVIGMEKSPKDRINYPIVKEIDSARIRQWTDHDGPHAKKFLLARNKHLNDRMTDPKSVIVSHIVEYTSAYNAISPSSIYNVYKTSGFVRSKNSVECTPPSLVNSFYESSWEALECLHKAIDRRMSRAKGKGKRYTHIIIASMGWNNDQLESVRRYNAIIGNLQAISVVNEEYFRPLVLGFTWPSVWGGESFFNSVNRLGHLGSYPVKADDADEIGYGIGNHIVNSIVPKLAHSHRFKTVLIGHSFGARILTRSFMSGHLLQEDESERYKHPKMLMLSLQGAFSVRRFKPTHKTSMIEGIPNEGAPYILHKTVPGKIVLTWSANDRANPAARYITGASHAGGEKGFNAAQDEIADEFDFIQWPENGVPSDFKCADHKSSEKVLMVDATNFVAEHGDVLDEQMGKFIWDMMHCFSFD